MKRPGKLPGLFASETKGEVMIVVMKAGATKQEKEEVLNRIRELGYKPHVIHGTTRDVIAALISHRA